MANNPRKRRTMPVPRTMITDTAEDVQAEQRRSQLLMREAPISDKKGSNIFAAFADLAKQARGKVDTRTGVRFGKDKHVRHELVRHPPPAIPPARAPPPAASSSCRLCFAERK